MDELTTLSLIGLTFALLLVFGFEFVDASTTRRTPVQPSSVTRTKPAMLAVIWSGLMNLPRRCRSSSAVAFGIVVLLPVESVFHAGSGPGYAVAFALLVSAIIWNLGTWWRGLLDIEFAYTHFRDHGRRLDELAADAGPHLRRWSEQSTVEDSIVAVPVSPVIGFVVTGGILWLAKALARYPALFKASLGTRRHARHSWHSKVALPEGWPACRERSA